LDLATAGKCFLDKKTMPDFWFQLHDCKPVILRKPVYSFDHFIKPRSNQLTDGIADTFVSAVEVLSRRSMRPCRLSRGGFLLGRVRYQQASLRPEKRKNGSAVWVYRWWEKDIRGKPVRRKLQIGGVREYSTESSAQAAADAIRLNINNHSTRNILNKATVRTLWEHYSREELPLKEMSTQDAYLQYVKNWILPRWGDLLLEEVKTVEVERWLRAAEMADGSKAKIKCVMSALFSHAVRWEFCTHNPISSGIPVGVGARAGPALAFAAVPNAAVVL